MHGVTRCLPASWNSSEGATSYRLWRSENACSQPWILIGETGELALDDLAKAAKKVVHPEAVTWVIVGDRAQIEPKIRELGFSEVIVIDVDGNVVK